MGAIAGIVNLKGDPVSPEILRRMSAALAHRGEEESLVERAGIGLAARRHPQSHESHGRATFVDTGGKPFAYACDGQVFNIDELSAHAGISGDRAPSKENAAKAIEVLWERHHEALFDRLRGQFALALWDERQRRLVVARDHFGVCPLHWTRQGDLLLFASEIKGLLASGIVDARADLRGIHHAWTFFGMPGPITCFQGVSALQPGRYLDVRLDAARAPGIHERVYWRMNFPDAGQEDNRQNEDQLVDHYEALMLDSIGRRLRGEPPVVAYSSGGLDSSLIVAMAKRVRGEPLDTFTFRIAHPHLDETSKTADVAGHIGGRAEVLELSGSDLIEGFRPLVEAAESPVIDVSASALLQLAEQVRRRGHRAVLTGEGADELQAGYPWFRIRERLDRLDRVTHLPLSRRGFRAYVRFVHSRELPVSFIDRAVEAAGGTNAWLLAYTLMATAKCRFFNRETLGALIDHMPLDDLDLDQDGLRRWHPLHRSIYLGTRVHLPGLHLAARGDRAAGWSGIETRYPFLDRELFDFLAVLDPTWKLRGREDKYLQRRLTDRWLPPTVTAGRKKLLHAPLDAFHRATPPRWAEQLLSEESLRRAGYFDPAAVRRWRGAIHDMRDGFRRLFIEMGLVGVLSTQLWHQRFIDPGLVE